MAAWFNFDSLIQKNMTSERLYRKEEGPPWLEMSEPGVIRRLPGQNSCKIIQQNIWQWNESRVFLRLSEENVSSLSIVGTFQQ